MSNIRQQSVVGQRIQEPVLQGVNHLGMTVMGNSFKVNELRDGPTQFKRQWSTRCTTLGRTDGIPGMVLPWVTVLARRLSERWTGVFPALCGHHGGRHIGLIAVVPSATFTFGFESGDTQPRASDCRDRRSVGLSSGRVIGERI